jgi:predicted GIY-YIG superfamily endonuclease
MKYVLKELTRRVRVHHKTETPAFLDLYGAGELVWIPRRLHPGNSAMLWVSEREKTGAFFSGNG